MAPRPPPISFSKLVDCSFGVRRSLSGVAKRSIEMVGDLRAFFWVNGGSAFLYLYDGSGVVWSTLSISWSKFCISVMRRMSYGLSTVDLVISSLEAVRIGSDTVFGFL